MNGLDRRLPSGERSLQEAARAGLQDSMPRAAVLAIHARVEGATPSIWEHPSLAQVWGPRYQLYVVAAADLALFTLGRFPDEAKAQRRDIETAARLRDYLAGRRLGYGEAGRGLGVNPNSLRYGSTTGTMLLRWEGARQPVVWTIPPPDIGPLEARRELARRYLHVFAPSTPGSFAKWAGISDRAGVSAFTSLESTLTAVSTPVGAAWILAEDEPLFEEDGESAAARLLPSGDAYFLLWGAERALLVPDAAHRGQLWTSRVWPGAVLVDGEIRGTWRRAHDRVTVEAWERLSPAQREAVEGEAAGLPLPGLDGPIRVDWRATSRS